VKQADTVFVNGNVITVDERFSLASAVAIRDGRILAVGDEEQVAAFSGPETEVVDLAARTLMPGFVDTHGHIALFGLETLMVSLAGAKSIAEIQERIGRRAAETPPGQWVVTTPVGDPPYFLDTPNGLAERRFPNRHDLDRASTKHPIYVTAPTNRVPNSAVLNSAALALAGIDRSTPRDFEGIEVEKDPQTGEPTGELHGMQPIYNPSAFFARFSALLPPFPYEAIRQGIENLAPEFVAGGTTALLEAHLTSPDELRAYAELDAAGKLPLRVFFTFDLDGSKPLAEIEEQLRLLSFAAGSGFGSDRVRVVGVSIGLDGPHWHGSAVADRPYPGPYGKVVNPEPLVPREKYVEIVKAAARRGFRVHAEAAGRGSIAIALAAMNAADEESPIRERRFVLEHCEFPTREQIAECKRLGVVPTTATNFIWGKGAEVYRERLGDEYAAQAIPLRDWLDAGVPVSQSTDWGPRSALFTVWQSLARQAGLTREVIGPSQRITREEAIRIFTRNGAYALGMETKLGSIEPGKLADLIVLSADPLTVPEDEIAAIEVIATLVDGRPVHGASALEGLVSGRAGGTG
jgi:predicted amidohydrolase YtcJ